MTDAQNAPGRVLAIDFGTSRLGLAVSDSLQLTAQGLGALERRNEAAVLDILRRLVAEYDVRQVLVSNPLGMRGGETAMSARATHFAQKLRRSISCEVRMWDERLTTAEANRMLRSSGMSRAKRSRAVDGVAATLILQNYLDWQAHARVEASES